METFTCQTKILCLAGWLLLLNACGPYTKTDFRTVYYDDNLFEESRIWTALQICELAVILKKQK